MTVNVFDDAEAVAREAAATIAGYARAAVAARGRFVMAVSGGRTPLIMLRRLAGEDVPWGTSTACRSTSAWPLLAIRIETSRMCRTA